MRATGAPSGAVARITCTPDTGGCMSPSGWLARPSARAFRRSTNTVSGSGWLVR